MSDKQLCINCLQETYGAYPCPICRWSPEAQKSESGLYLAPGIILHDQYQIAKVLGHGGFGITYLALDTNLQIKLAIKEYMPRDFATRNSISGEITVFAGDAKENFAYGLNSFLEEARTLAKFQQHAGIVSVLNFFKANGTGYMVMEYVEGLTLKEHLTDKGKLSWDQTLQLFMPVMDALREVHKNGVLHRDISPDNIYLCQDSRIKLLDFGSARFALGGHSRSLSVVVKPGYAPEEQYRTKGNQGAWTDVYSVAACMYRCVAGTAPPDALDRLDEDDLITPAKLGIQIPKNAEQALMTALAVKAVNRLQSIEQFQQALLNERNTSSHTPTKKPSPSPREQNTPPTDNTKSGKWAFWILIVAVAFIWLNSQDEDNKTETITNGKAPLHVPIAPVISKPVEPQYGIQINNKCREPITTALVYWNGEDWVAKGWFKSEPLSMLDTEVFTRSKDVYSYAYSDKHVSEGTKDKGLPRYITKSANFTSYTNAPLKADDKILVTFLVNNPEEKVNSKGTYLELTFICPDKPEPVIDTHKEEIDVHPYDLVQSTKWKKKFVNITKNKYQAFVDRLTVASNTTLVGDWIVGYGLAPHSGGRDEAAFAIEVTSGNVFGAMLENGDKITEFGLGKSWKQAPDFLKKWASKRQLDITKNKQEEVKIEKPVATNNESEEKKLGDKYYQDGDYKLALQWYRKAADLGDSGAQHKIGVIYAQGKGVHQDDQIAVEWFKVSAEQANALGQNNLGFMYENGRGVPQNHQEAIKWYRKAADQGNPEAIKALSHRLFLRDQRRYSPR